MDDSATLLRSIAARFEQQKRRVLAALEQPDLCDRSRKGGVDAPIANVIERINHHRDYVTSSSCSGRVSIFALQSHHARSVAPADPLAPAAAGEPIDGACVSPASVADVPTTARKGGEWVLVSHEPVSLDEVLLACERLHEYPHALVSFKFEAMILHVQCRTLEAARLMCQCATEAGFRNSGFVIGRNKITLAVRSTMHFDAPIAAHGRLLVSPELLRLLVLLSNDKFAENLQRIERFEREIELRIQCQAPPSIADAPAVAPPVLDSQPELEQT